MGQHYIGVDFGTANTKVCVREDVEQLATAVPWRSQSDGTERYLIPSTDNRTWTDRDPPKIILLQRVTTAERDTKAMTAAVEAVTTAARAAVQLVCERSGSRNHVFVLNVGFPSEFERDRGDVVHRYALISEAVVDRLRGELRGTGASVERGSHDLDERSAVLIHLANSRYELSSQPIFLVDGGGYTLHMTIVRWREAHIGQPERGLSVHGACTALHGMSHVVGAVLNALTLVHRGATTADAIGIVDEVMGQMYAELAFGNTAPGREPQVATLRDTKFMAGVVQRAQSAAIRQNPDLLVGSVLTEIASFVSHPLVKHSWQTAWGPAWKRSMSKRFWENYPLVMTGGACRIGRPKANGGVDPLAHSIREMQSAVHDFSDVVYPEMDARFWLEEQASAALQKAMPYLFVAAGYTYPSLDWPRYVKPETVPPQAPVGLPIDPTDDG